MDKDARLSEAALQTIEQALQHALGRHKDGKLQEAEKLYQVILQIDPNHPKANHNMGALLLQTQQTAASLPYFTAALDADPAHGQYWLSYIDALFQDGQLETARQILALAQQQGLQGEDVDELVLCLHGADQIPQEISSEDPHERSNSAPVESAIQQGNSNPAKHNSDTFRKGPAQREVDSLLDLVNKGKVAEAVDISRTMTVRYPQYGLGWKVLGVLLGLKGRNPDALVPMQKAAELLPNDAEAHNNLGITLQDFGRYDEAIASYQRALAINPDYAEAHNGLGHAFQLKGMISKAESSFRRALKIKPNFPDALNKLGTVVKIQGRLDDARECFRHALEIQPDNAEAHNNLGSVLILLGRLDEAEACFRRAIQIKPDLAAAQSNLGGVMYELGLLEEAEILYRKALQIEPDNGGVHSNLLFCLSQDPAMDAQALFLAHCRFGEHFESGFRDANREYSNVRNPERTLQIGVVSGDLRDHAVAYVFEPVLECLSGYAQFSLHAYSNHNMDDSITARMRGNFAHWNSIAGMPDEVLAEKIRADGIDILIDLSNHTSRNRLLTFARKPAPVQITWIGYPGTTGLKNMDYYLSDRFFLPSGLMDDQFTEKIVRLPASAPFLPSKDAPPVKSLPALSNGYVTFGSFNRVSKLNPTVIALWSKLLRALPDSRMLLGGMPEVGGCETLIEWFAQEGIARERLDFHKRSGMERYLDLHHQVDICLDTFPYSGGTTTLHALWMGVPTLTLAGATAASRTGVTLLCHAGLDAFIAHDAADFVLKGLHWGGDLQGLAAVRATVRQHFAHSAMGQPQVVGASVALALRIMWKRWCAGMPSESFEVTQPELSIEAKGADK
ncbi:MAG: tetratricopeptide repeat protein [Sideroxyarcus sp.]|nr:tetratricopeptide repeat protein [Sideroxyarcus sp.]